MEKHESPESILSERDMLWGECNKLYNAITHNGALNSDTFRQAVGMTTNLMQGKMDMTHSLGWFSAMADFLQAVEKGRSQRVGPGC